MAEPKPPAPSIMLVAIFSRHRTALDWALERIAQTWGRLALCSDRFDHGETNYYQPTMGSGLTKQFVIVDGLYDPAQLSDSKLESNRWEAELAAANRFSELRPLNIDPGYITLTKLVLASAKDRAHRIYLKQGIYAEQCLYYLDHRWQARPWTYPDYQRDDFQTFFSQAREHLKRLVLSQPSAIQIANGRRDVL
ncbi:MAG: DUF4416 family protein [Planctomycetales bacterium]|nr:DUF4416 family protein [Planctomycetales bacterium]